MDVILITRILIDCFFKKYIENKKFFGVTS